MAWRDLVWRRNSRAAVSSDPRRKCLEVPRCAPPWRGKDTVDVVTQGLCSDVLDKNSDGDDLLGIALQRHSRDQHRNEWKNKNKGEKNNGSY